MMRRSLSVVLILGLHTLWAASSAQMIAIESTLVIETNAPDALVSINGVVVGLASEGSFPIGSGTNVVTLTDRSPEVWSGRQVTKDVVVDRDADRVVVELNLPVRYRIEAFPSEAEILHTDNGEEVALGRSPVVIDEVDLLEGHFVARMMGYEPATIPVGDSLSNRHTLILQPLVASTDTDIQSWTPPREPRRWIDYATAGVALASAGLAIYYKFEADEFDDRYREAGSPERGNPALRAEAERLDGYSLASLGVMQAAVGFLAIRFVLR